MRAGLLLAFLVLAAPQARAAAPVLAVVVPASHASEALRPAEVALVYKRKKLLWRDGRRIQPVNLPADHPMRVLFSTALLGETPEALQEYWNEQYFHGVRPPHVLASEAAMLRFVEETAEAIGYLPVCALDSQVRALFLIGADGELLPADTPLACKH